MPDKQKILTNEDAEIDSMTDQPDGAPETTGKVRSDLRMVALPTEHGGWGFLFEPILLGMFVAATLGGLLLSIATIAAFLARQPLKQLLLDRRRGVRTRRTELARQVYLAYCVVAAFAFAGALASSGVRFLAPLVLALPFGVVFAYYDLARPGRTLQAELSAPVALASVAASIALMDGWPWIFALTLWLLLIVRGLPAVLYVRARIRLDRARPTHISVPIVMHVVALLVVVWLISQQWTPVLTSLPYAILLLRAGIFLAPSRPQLPIKAIGFMELGLGLLTALLIAIGYWAWGPVY